MSTVPNWLSWVRFLPQAFLQHFPFGGEECTLFNDSFINFLLNINNSW